MAKANRRGEMTSNNVGLYQGVSMKEREVGAQKMVN